VWPNHARNSAVGASSSSHSPSRAFARETSRGHRR
jgi:hypothetical protein